MKAVILATAMTIVLLLLVTLALRHRPTPRRARQMMLSYVVCLIAAASVWFATSADLGFLGPSLLIEPPWLDWAGFLYDANLTGMPAVALPCGSGDDGLPVSLQLMSRRGSDGALLALAEAVERAIGRGGLPRFPSSVSPDTIA